MTQKQKIANNILIADDDPVSRRLLEAHVVKWGYQVVTAADGLEALKILEGENAPSLAVLDWMMPGMEGPQVCQRVRALPDRPYVYVILLTARTQQDDILLGLESGADDYLTKPFNAPELRARLHVGQRILDLQNRLIGAGEALRFHATHDELTGLSNRRVVLQTVSREYSRHAREAGTFGIILIDLDHFKKVNDTCGHLAGDAVLKQAARRISACVRPYDTVGRYGGEEFLVVAPSCDRQSSMRLSERIREFLQAAPIETEAGPVTVTASCGVAVSNAANPLDAHHLLLLADEALYRAKELGRNRSEIATESQLTSSR